MPSSIHLKDSVHSVEALNTIEHSCSGHCCLSAWPDDVGHDQGHHPVIFVKMDFFFKMIHFLHSYLINFDLHQPLQKRKILMNCYISLAFVCSTRDSGFNPHECLLAGT